MEYASLFCQRCYLVSVLRCYRAFGRNVTGSYQCHTKCLDAVLRHCQFVCGYYWFACEQFVGSRTKGTGNSAMQQSYSFGICYRFSSGHPCSDFLPSDYWHLYGKYVSDANCPSALCGYAAELCLCLARLCLYERRNRYRGDTHDIHFPVSVIYLKHKHY